VSRLQVLPAIDLRDGRCVRLHQGDFGRETIFGDDPVAMARHWEGLGAERLHLVDLDGARAGRPTQLQLVGRIVGALTIPVQLGGGLRSLEHVEAAFDAGIERVVLGTAAIRGKTADAPRAFRQACLSRFPGRIVIGLDARGGRLAVDGWTETTSQDAHALAVTLRDEGLERIVYTDIARDGALSGPNLAHLRRLVSIDGLRVIASGGVSALGDLIALDDLGAEAAIVGQALYTGRIDLTEALAQLRSRAKVATELASPC
jgi:phosphoribosylformimino-5-aminoimidazole carboxamide ribotide isomerase